MEGGEDPTEGAALELHDLNGSVPASRSQSSVEQYPPASPGNRDEASSSPKGHTQQEHSRPSSDDHQHAEAGLHGSETTVIPNIIHGVSAAADRADRATGIPGNTQLEADEVPEIRVAPVRHRLSPYRHYIDCISRALPHIWNLPNRNVRATTGGSVSCWHLPSGVLANDDDQSADMRSLDQDGDVSYNEDSEADGSRIGSTDRQSVGWQRSHIIRHDEWAAFLPNMYGSLYDETRTFTAEAVHEWAARNVFTQVCRSIVPRPATLIFAATDLTPALIDALGAAFDMDPEVFEEHLYDSSFATEQQQQPPPDSWCTNGMQKSWRSLRWLRPVLRRPLPPAPMRSYQKDTIRNVGRHKTRDPLKVSWDVVEEIGVSEAGITQRKRISHTVEPVVNVFRNEISLATDPYALEKAGDPVDNLRHPRGVPWAWEERATVWHSFLGNQEIFDEPDPEDEVGSNPRSTLVRTAGTVVTEEETLPFSLAWHRALPGQDRRDDLRGQRLETWADEQLRCYATGQDWSTYLAADGMNDDDIDSQSRIDAGLLHIVLRDTQGLVYYMTTALQEISKDSLDDHVMQQRLYHWRATIQRFQLELPRTKSSVKEYLSLFNDAKLPESAATMYRKTLRMIDDCIAQTDKTYSALRADMSILESKRGIAQAESVGKLTELAFIFIPLTFITGLFSMQIDELQPSVPIRSFIIASVIAMMLAYGTRLAVRSSLLVEPLRKLAADAAQHNNLQPGQTVSTRAFVSFMCMRLVTFLKARFGMASLILLIIVITFVALLATMWSFVRLNTGYKSTMTNLLFFVFATFAWFMTSNFLTYNLLKYIQANVRRLRIRARRRRDNGNDEGSFAT